MKVDSVNPTKIMHCFGLASYNDRFCWRKKKPSISLLQLVVEKKSPTEDMNKNLLGWDYVSIYRGLYRDCNKI